MRSRKSEWLRKTSAVRKVLKKMESKIKPENPVISARLRTAQNLDGKEER
jgi:hypothetical protein